MKPSCFIPRGPGPTTAAVERREASIPRHGMQGASHAPAGVRHSPAQRVPLHPSACRRSASLDRRGREMRKPRRTNASRERCRLRSLYPSS